MFTAVAKLTVVPRHTVVAVAVMLIVGATGELTVIVTALLVAGQEEDGLTIQVITSPLTKKFGLKFRLVLFVPTTTPFTSHCNTGEAPPLVTVAVKKAVPPLHIEVDVAAIETAALGNTVTVTLSTEAQPVALAKAVLTKYFVVIGPVVVLVSVIVGLAMLAALRLVAGVHE